jgi:hypothetical protein
MQASSIEHMGEWIRLVQAEYAEMPGLHLSKRQAQRLWNLDPQSIDMVLEALESSHFLRRTPKGMYTRAEIGF